MRNLDNYEQLFDNDKNFLHGKLVFCQKGTTTQEPVFAWDSEHNAYVPVTPIVYTDVNGRPNVQIYLADKDYTIYVYKYIGNGDMTLDSDDENWTFQYSFNNLYNVFGLDIKSNAVTLIDRMEALKETDPEDVPAVDGKRLVALGGYQTLGDCPAVYYRWSDVSTETANDVDVVAVTGITTGRWLLVNTFSETGIFDVRHAGCFPKSDEASVDVTQSYALQKADTYAQKFGLTLFVPSIFDNYNSYYIGTNISIYSPIWFADGAKIVTATSLTLNEISEKNVGRRYPFILHSDSNNGSITCGGNIIHTSWFENTETSNPSTNWPPSIDCRRKFVYDSSLGAVGVTTTFTLEDREVEVLALMDDETFSLTNCKIVSDENMKNANSFTDCEIKGTFFDSGANIISMTFSGCHSDIDTWSNTNKFVFYSERNGDKFLDLKGRVCSIDYETRHVPFPFNVIHHAVFSDKITLPSGTFLTILDSEVSSIVIDDDNSVLTNINIVDSNVSFYNDSSYKLFVCDIVAQGSTILSDSGHHPFFKFASLDDCIVGGDLAVYDSTATISVVGCKISADIIVQCTSGFQITFDNNVISDGAELVMLSNSSSTTIADSSFCNNVVEESAKREFIDFSGVDGFDVDDVTYRYDNNSGVEKGCRSISKHFHVKYRTYGNTDTGDYVLQLASNDDECKLVGDGFKLNSLLFNFGEKTRDSVRAYTDTRYTGVPNHYYTDGGTYYSAHHADSAFNIYDAGIDGDTHILGCTFGIPIHLDSVAVDHNTTSDEDYVDFVLNVSYIEG